MNDTRQLSLLPILDAPTPRTRAVAELLPELGRALELEDQHLARSGSLRLPALPIRVSCRANRTTMGSLRHRTEPVSHWALCLATSLVENDPEAALLLGRVLLMRVRRLAVPMELRRLLKQDQARWLSLASNRPAHRDQFEVSDPGLLVRLEHVARTAALGMPQRGLPRIVWHVFATARVLGRYDERANLIRINKALAESRTPVWSLDALVFHEFLHALLGAEQQGSRRVHHHGRFRLAEAAWPDHERWVEWIRTDWPACHRRWKRRQ